MTFPTIWAAALSAGASLASLAAGAGWPGAGGEEALTGRRELSGLVRFLSKAETSGDERRRAERSVRRRRGADAAAGARRLAY
ncbi:hypothetical protein BE11_37315 [Sorangium cellulosum]|nr:hypothetical protein BE11_37315 [Sorangium cellulosum]